MDIFNSEEQEQLAHAIGLAEARTSGEIRVCVERRCKQDVLIRAQECFFHLGMHQTALRNGVLLYLSTDDHQFAIIGDQGIDSKVANDFWDLTKEKMLSHFKSGDLLKGLITGIACAGEQLQHLFPRAHDDVNELPNDIVFIDRHHTLNS
ncbi:TPM domain-containing protein [Olivibacter ginsenosidimutans]|uniref:TPM domain-containing protein n=1 Tax=Olivibacter ginsenosidimutans TaxID=1176537 RepID=A0ABP9C780_9SPHI